MLQWRDGEEGKGFRANEFPSYCTVTQGATILAMYPTFYLRFGTDKLTVKNGDYTT